jgi:hypothetical protein
MYRVGCLFDKSSLLSRQVCVNGPGGLLAGAHGEDHRGGAGDDVAAGINAQAGGLA